MRGRHHAAARRGGGEGRQWKGQGPRTWSRRVHARGGDDHGHPRRDPGAEAHGDATRPAYLERIQAYNGTCVDEPEGILGPITMIPNAGKVNAMITLNLRPSGAHRVGLRRAQGAQQTDPVDDDPTMPDALETAAALDRSSRSTGKLVGPLHGVVFAIKDQYDTFDMRTTSGADAFWANDRPPDDATFIARLRAAGAIILAKANMDEYAGGDAAQLVRRHRLQRLRHPARPGRLERRLGRRGRDELGDLRHRARRPAARSSSRRAGQRRRPRADARARQRRRHDPARYQHARRARCAAPSRTSRACSTSTPATIRRTSSRPSAGPHAEQAVLRLRGTRA